MKTFKDLKFKKHPAGFGEGKISRVEFDNGWGASVVSTPYTYGGDRGLYELAVLKDNDIHYDNLVAGGDVIGYLSEIEVTGLLIEIQKF